MASNQERIETENLSQDGKKEKHQKDLPVQEGSATEARAIQSSFAAKRLPIDATVTSNKMLHTVSAGMYQQQSVDKVGAVEMIANDALMAAQTQNFIPDVTNLTHVQSGYQNVSNEDALQKSFTVFEEVDHSKKSMIQFLTKVGSIQNLQ